MHVITYPELKFHPICKNDPKHQWFIQLQNNPPQVGTRHFLHRDTSYSSIPYVFADFHISERGILFKLLLFYNKLIYQRPLNNMEKAE